MFVLHNIDDKAGETGKRDAMLKILNNNNKGPAKVIPIFILRILLFFFCKR